MKRKILLSIITFVVIFITALWLSLPYENIAVKAIKTIEQTAKIDLKYDQLKSGPLSTSISALEAKNIPLGELSLNHSPLNLIFGNIGYKLSGTINSEGKLSANNVTLVGNISSGVINNFTDQVKITGDLKADIRFNPQNSSAEVVAQAGKAGIKTPMGMMDFEKVSIEVSSKGKRVNIRKLASDDSMALNLSGTIIINERAPERSTVNIRGTFNLAGQKKEIILNGRADRLTPSIR